MTNKQKAPPLGALVKEELTETITMGTDEMAKMLSMPKIPGRAIRLAILLRLLFGSAIIHTELIFTTYDGITHGLRRFGG